jgi:hypothetical protein
VAKAYHSQQGKIVTVAGAKVSRVVMWENGRGVSLEKFTIPSLFHPFQVLLHKLGEVEEGYLDPKSKQILMVDARAEVRRSDWNLSIALLLAHLPSLPSSPTEGGLHGQRQWKDADDRCLGARASRAGASSGTLRRSTLCDRSSELESIRVTSQHLKKNLFLSQNIGCVCRIRLGRGAECGDIWGTT